jgi:hypothetical protein
MVRNSRIAVAALVCCAPIGCKAKPAPEPQQAELVPVAQPQTAPIAPSIYDAQGRLKPSGERVDWLEIPMGFRRKEHGYDRHILFEAQGVSLDKAREFFATRMLTGKVEESLTRQRYVAVMSVAADEAAVRLNVELTLRTFDNSLALDIERLTYGDAKPLPVEEARKVLAREQARAE